MKWIKKVFKYLVITLLALIIGYNVNSIVQLKILKKDLATINGYGVLEVITGSMEPTIHIKDMIVINTKEKDYQVDDIITFYDSNNLFVTHRIISINEDEIITQGDNNNTEDKPITKDKIVGKYQFRIKGLGAIISSLKSPITMTLIFVIGLLLCAFLSIDKNGQVIQEDKEYLEFKKFQEKNNKK